MSVSWYFWASQEAQWQNNICLQMQLTQEIRFDLWVKKIPWKRKWQPPPVFLSGKPHGQRSLAGYSPWSHRVRHNWACTCSVILILYFRTHQKYYFYLLVESFSCVPFVKLMEHVDSTLLSRGYLLGGFLCLVHFQKSKNLIAVHQGVQGTSKRMFWITMFTYLLPFSYLILI